MTLLAKVLRHARSGTLFSRIGAKLFGAKRKSAPSSKPDGDTYYGACADDYLAKRTQQDYWHLEQKLVADLLDEFPDGLAVLDVPFGTGRFVPEFLAKNMQITGLDASKDMLDVARRELGDKLDQCRIDIGDATRLPYEAGSFDLVVCIRFLTHIINFEQAKLVLDEFRRVSRGKLLIQARVRRPDVPAVPLPVGGDKIGDRMTLEQLTTLLAEHGLVVEKIESIETRETYSRAVLVCSVAKS